MSAASLRGRVVVVTGAAKGIGAATATLLAGIGAKLVLADRDGRGLDAMLPLLGDQDSVLAVPTDVRSPEQLEALARRTVERWGRVDAVINCAAVLHPGGVDECPEARVRDQLDINLLGTINVSRAFLPRLRRQGAGHLVLVASLGGMVPMPHSAVYCATKFAVRGFALSLALELRGTGVHVTALCPDSTRTPQLAGEARGGGSSLSFTSAPMDPRQVARAIVSTLLRPRIEVTVPAVRGRLIRLLGAMPRLFERLYPVLERRGRRGLERFLAELEPAALPGPPLIGAQR